MATALGSGILSLPKLFSNIGYLSGSIYIVLGGLISITTMMMLFKAIQKTGISVYTHLVEYTLGTKMARIF